MPDSLLQIARGDSERTLSEVTLAVHLMRQRVHPGRETPARTNGEVAAAGRSRPKHLDEPPTGVPANAGYWRAYSSADRDSNSNPTKRSSPTTHAS